ncbi:TPA: transcriptional regulator [Klebsiella michiganensis]|nr:transcriptional regulator [Klebsiella michiganensis]
MLIPKFFMWSECSFQEYESACYAFGYNCESSPDFISFKMRNNAALKFYAYKKKGEILGSVCIENGWVANDHKNPNRELPGLLTPKSSIFVPICSSLKKKVILPFRTKCLHPLQQDVFLNTSYNIFNKRHAAFSKNPTIDFSKKTISTREREIRKFLDSGGLFMDIDQLTGEHIFKVYETLYEARRNKKIRMPGVNLKFFQEFENSFKGHVMFWHGEPIAIQLLLSVSGKAGMFVDFINIGYRKDINAGSLGTMLMWKNLTALYQEAAENNLNLYYSYGMMSGEYKTRWCHPVSLGRSII